VPHPSGLVAVHAHPDDETLTMGGTLAQNAAAGIPVTLVTATLGEQGEVVGPELRGLTAEHADQLGGYRLGELDDACAALGVSDHRMLGGVGAFRDSGMAGTPSVRHPRAFVRAAAGGPDHDRAVAALVEVLREVRPAAVLTYDANGGYGHPDHIAAHQVALAAAGAAGVPRVLAVCRATQAWRTARDALAVPAGLLPAVADPADLVMRPDVEIRLDEADLTRRRAALAAHLTQLGVIPGGFALTNRVAQPLLDGEYFLLLAGAELPVAADDLFAGL